MPSILCEAVNAVWWLCLAPFVGVLQYLGFDFEYPLNSTLRSAAEVVDSLSAVVMSVLDTFVKACMIPIDVVVTAPCLLFSECCGGGKQSKEPFQLDSAMAAMVVPGS